MAETDIVALLEHLGKKQQKQREKQERYEDFVTSRVSAKADYVKVVVFDEEPEHTEEVIAQRIYHRLKDDYATSRNVFIPRMELTKSELTFWRRVVAHAAKAECSVAHFLKAQFEYFHRAFKKAPEPKHLLTDAAILRAKEYTFTHQRVVGSVIDKQNQAELFTVCNKQMLQLQKAQKLTREQVYTDLVLPGHVYFPAAFLAADPLYRKVKAQHG